MALVVLAALLAGCSVPGAGDGEAPSPAPRAGGAPAVAAPAPTPPGGPIIGATANTVRLGGAGAVQDAAAVARAVFPGTSAASRPGAVVVVDQRDWPGALAAAALAAPPARATVLLSAGGVLPPASREALTAVRPTGAGALGGQQVLHVGAAAPVPDGVRAARVPGTEAGDPAARAAAVDVFASGLRPAPSRDVLVVSGDDPAWGMPAGAWAARSGHAVLLTGRDALPTPTRERIEARRRPRVTILGPRRAVSSAVERELRALGPVRRIAGASPVENAIALARRRRGAVGWGIAVPGANVTVASAGRPLDGAAAAALGANGVFAPLLLADRADRLPAALEGYLLDVQPGYEGDPGDAVYNRVWILGDESALSARAQARLDEVAALVPVGP